MSNTRIGLRKQLIAVILIAVAFPYLCVTVLTLVVNLDVSDIKEKTTASYVQANESLRKAMNNTETLFKLSALRRSETLSNESALIVSMRNLIESELPNDRYMLEMVQTARIGEESQVSILNPFFDKIILDKYVEPGGSIDQNLPLVSRLMREKGYLKILKDLRTNPSLQDNIGTISAVYRPRDMATNSETGPESESAKFVIVRPIKDTPYSLSVVASIGGLTRQVVGEMEGSLNQINQTLMAIDQKSRKIRSTSLALLIAGALVGGIIVILLFRSTRLRVINPVRELTDTAEAIRRGDLDRRVRLDGMREEFLELGQALNRMLDTTTELIQSEEDKKRIQENIISLLELVSRASDGDLTERGQVSEDVLGSVMDAFNMMLDHMSNLVAKVREAGMLISMGANSIMDASRKIALDAKRQGREIHYVTSMVQQAARSMQRVSFSADMANEEAQKATIAAKEGAGTVNATIQSMQRMRSNVQSTAKTIKTLGDRSLEINAIVELINDISARTNILSLNATIEASKAGEQGKGFAVVADEIRKLAERTSNATKEISSFIEDIQIETNDAVLAMEEVTREVEQGWKQADQAGSTLRQIDQVIGAAAEKIMEISNVSRQMVNQTDEIGEQIKSIYQVSRETTEGIYRSTKETKNLYDPLLILNSLIHSYRLQPDFDRGLKATWMLPALKDQDTTGLANLLGESDFDPQVELAAAEGVSPSSDAESDDDSFEPVTD